MKISVIAPPYIPIPPKMYGGIEIVAYDIVEALHKAGHKVNLFAPKESTVSCNLIPYVDGVTYFGIDSPLETKRLMGEVCAKFAYAMSAYLDSEIIHDHTLFNFKGIKTPVVHTLHGPANEASVKKCMTLTEKGNNYFVAISDRQKELFLEINPNINFISTVHNGIDVSKIEWTKDKEDFLFFIGRSNWEKGLDLAIRVASKAEENLTMSVKMSEQFEKDFFNKEIQPWIDSYPSSKKLELLDEILPSEKYDFYRKAKCTLFTSQWEEPFGLVMIESMACGTPVVSLKKGAAPEVIVDGVTGFLVDSEEEMVDAVKEINKIKPEACRKHVEENFSSDKMAAEYLSAYKKILNQ